MTQPEPNSKISDRDWNLTVQVNGLTRLIHLVKWGRLKLSFPAQYYHILTRLTHLRIIF